MSVRSLIRGTFETIFQIGKGGSQLKTAGAAALEARNAGDTDYATMKVATPTADNDAATKLYVDSSEGSLIVKRQANTSASLPNNTAVRGWVVVTTAGTGAVVGDVLFDDGSSSGTMTIYAAVEGRGIAVTDALAGGTVEFDADSIYQWDDDGTVWVKIGDIGSVTGPVRVVRFAIGTGASQDSASQIPANAIIHESRVNITTLYDNAATITVGSTATAALVQAATDNDPLATDIYHKVQDDAWEVAASVVRVAITGAPTVGVGTVAVFFSNPNV